MPPPPKKPYTIDDWARSDSYHNSFLVPPDDALDAALANSASHGLPSIAVSRAQGRFLNLLVKSLKAKRVLEVGTLGGYSTIWLARAVPEGGSVITCELKEKHAKVARENLTNAGLASKVQVLIGPAAETLKSLNPPEPFDFVFIDADKQGNLTYFLEAKRLVKSGGVIIVDNVVRHGHVADPALQDEPRIVGIRRLLEHLKTDREVEATTLGTAGEKGWDGFMYIVKL